MKKIGAVVVACGVLGAFAAETLVPRGEALVVSNATDATEANVLRGMYGARGVDKVGAGVYALPRGQVDACDPLTVNALEGDVAVTDAGTLPTPTAPSNVLKLASFWLEASANRQTNENGAITAWYDCREAKTGDNAWGGVYARAKTILSPKDSKGAVYSPVMPVATNLSDMTQPMIFFGRYQKGTGMGFYKGDSTTAFGYEAIRHVYAVVNFQYGYGYPIGANSALMLHPTVFGYESTASYYSSGDVAPYAQQGEFLLNGARCNPQHTLVRKGLQLIELHATSDVPMSSFGYIFNDRTCVGRCGGDFVGEILVFNGEKGSLTESERLQVSRYLMHKWGIAPTQGKLTVRLGERSSLTAAVDTAVAGRGVVERSGGETAHYRPTAASPASGTKVHLSAGTMRADVRELNLSVKSGEALSFAMDSLGVHTVTAGAAAAGEAAVAGASEIVRLGRIDDGVAKLTVGAKGVTLGDAGVGGDRLTDGIGVATVANGSFETNFSASGWVWVSQYGSSNIERFTSEESVLDWRISGTDTDRVAFSNAVRLARFMPTDGSQALLLKQGNLFYGHVTVSKDGDYVLAFDGSGRYNFDNMQLILSLVDAAETTNTFACCTVPMGNGLHPFRFPLSALKAGAYKLVIESKSGKAACKGLDSHAILDNFRMSFVTDGLSSVGGVPVPNGSFENTRITDASRSVTAYGTNGLACAGWTLTSPDAPAEGAVACVSRLMKDYYLPGERDLGVWQLRFHGPTGRATSEAFSLPAGRWTLRCKAAKWAFDGVKWNNVSGRTKYPILAVRVFKNGTQVFDESSVALSTYDMQSIFFKNELEVDADDRIVLELRQTATDAYMNVDDLEFVPAGTWGASKELVSNGSFESDYSDWTCDANAGYYWLKTLNGGYEEHYGGQRCDGEKALCMKNNAAISQAIAFPAAGVYRLSFWARSRVSHYGADKSPNTHDYGGNVLRASLIAGGVTNAIVETPSVFSTNFNQTVALFRVPSAGTHRLCIAGVNDPVHGVWTGGSKSDCNVFLDCISVTAAPEGGAAPDLPANLDLRLTGDSKLRLDYGGTATVYRLRIGTKRFHGPVDASVAPDLVTGPGVLNVTEPQPGMTLIMR